MADFNPPSVSNLHLEERLHYVVEIQVVQLRS